MRASPRHVHRWFPAVGGALLIVGALIVAILPASASTPRLPAPSAAVMKLASSPNSRTTTTTSTSTTTTQPTTGTTGGVVPCPTGDPSSDTCADLPCKAGQYCGTVVAGPTQNLGPGQFVYLSFSAFAPGDTNLFVYYCADPGGGPLNASGVHPRCAAPTTGRSQRRHSP